jgi:hypothetical protein
MEKLIYFSKLKVYIKKCKLNDKIKFIFYIYIILSRKSNYPFLDPPIGDAIMIINSEF